MKNLFNSLKTLCLMIISVILFFMSITAFTPSLLLNLLLLVVSIIILLVACDNFDKCNHLGNYSKNEN